jgi:ABC-type sugar transport system substrate-binding protein
MQKALDASLKILQNNPDVKGFYCNNDVMALGAAGSLKASETWKKILKLSVQTV